MEDPAITSARPGDRVILPVSVGDKYIAERLMADLKARGVEVELRHETINKAAFLAKQPQMANNDSYNSVSNDIAMVKDGRTPVDNRTIEQAMSDDIFNSFNYDQANPIRIFTDYMNLVGQADEFNASNSNSNQSYRLLVEEESADLTLLPVEERKRQLFEKVLKEGSAIVDALCHSSEVSENGAGPGLGEVKELQLQQVRLRNFGPYGGPQDVIYPLANRGLSVRLLSIIFVVYNKFSCLMFNYSMY